MNRDRRLSSSTSALPTALSLCLLLGIVVCSAGLTGKAAAQRIYLNEVVIADFQEQVELYNPNPYPFDLTGLKIVGSLGEYPIPPETVIPPLEYLTIPIVPPGDIFQNLGGETSIADMADELIFDRVVYGQLGGAPLPHPESGVSLCRAPDAAQAPPLYDEIGYSDAGNWTLDLSSTFGGANDAPIASLGSTVKINEYRRGFPEKVEFFNPFALAVDIDLTGWFLTDGTTAEFLSGTVPGGGVLVVDLATTQIETTRLIYLFDDMAVRVDQLGFLGSPDLGELCLARCPDGAGPYDGYDWTTSGGGATLFVQDCSLGELNSASACSGPSSTDESSSWGRIRMLFR